MSEQFSWFQRGIFSVLEFLPWTERGIVHGFIGTSADFRTSALSLNAGPLAQSVHRKVVMVVHQLHGDGIVELMENLPVQDDGGAMVGKGDALAGSAELLQSSGALLGIRTADCLPILVIADRRYFAVHAGWRGLACGIIDRVVARCAGSSVFEVVIGPCAGAARYEVGQEVIDAIGERCQCTPTAGSRFILDLAATATRQIECACGAWGIKPRVFSSGICTITDPRWHSYRRDGAGCGSNLAFLGGPS